jgi:hypothetical protein
MYVLNEVLMYASFHRGSSTKDSVIAALAGSCDTEALKKAKDVLYDEFGISGVLKEYKNRLSSSNRTEKMALAEDIVDSLGLIVEKRIPVIFTAANWEKLPKVHPSRLCDIAMADQLAELSRVVDVLQSNLSQVKGEVVINSDRIKVIEDDADTHGKLIQQCIQRQDNDPRGVSLKEWPLPKGQQSHARVVDEATASSVMNMSSSGAPDDEGVASNTQQSSNNDAPTKGHGNRPGGSVAASNGTNEGGQLNNFQRPKDQIRREIRRNRKGIISDTSTEVPGQRPRQNRGMIVGLNSNSTLRAAPLPSRDIFISRIHKNDGVNELDQFLKSKDVTPRELSLVCHEESKFNSFKLTVSADDVSKVLDAEMWPVGVRLRKWFDNRKGPSERLGSSS